MTFANDKLAFVEEVGTASRLATLMEQDRSAAQASSSPSR
jgi:hypothetical protein